MLATEEKTEPAAIAETPSAEIPSPAQAASDPRQYRIPGDLVNKATADLPDEQRSAVRRLHAYYIDHALSLSELERETNIDASIITQVFRGKYAAKLDNTVEKINRFFALVEKRRGSRKLDFIETALARNIWRICDAALEFQRIAFIFGESQIGKTEALRKFRDDHNHGATIYIEVPTGGRLMDFICELAELLRIPTGMRSCDLRQRILSAFDDKMLLIVDEVHRCIPEDGYVSRRSIQTLEFIRELHDKRRCGLVLSATNVFRDALDGGKFGKVLGQSKRRQVGILQLPSTPTKGDLNTFAAAYGLPPAEGKALELQTRAVEEDYLGMWLTLLRMAAKLAKNQNRAMTWTHVEKARAGLLAMKSGNMD